MKPTALQIDVALINHSAQQKPQVWSERLPVQALSPDWAPRRIVYKRLLAYPLAPPSLRILLPRRAHVFFSFLFVAPPKGPGGREGARQNQKR